MSDYNIHSSYLPPRLILRFIAFSHGLRSIQYGTIRTYLAAIRFYCLRDGFSDPFLDMNDFIIPQFKMALRDMHRFSTLAIKQCKPMTINLLNILIIELRAGVFHP
ncbi:unnamed protein product [Rotaria sp. Silwood2]|nr:unnamed protein product [Rotaria sp. Silwood2]CAF2758623.1 unnamed protein product [Rotaria sp. Silwood2]CAF3188586.1 unnamed protein product [Rotaria sp. Silwood2]CAF4468784.1 unnamed protein product [Rotaria sp. Silwood2]CAF4489525.1 unnamed protein product [Rotaria sp. Silwood2]